MRLARIITFIMLSCSALSLFAADITETGYGKNEAEAIANADSLLAQRIATNTTSEQNTIISDDGSKAVSYISLNAITTYDTDFLGAVLTTKRENDGSWSATKTIPESSYSLYETRVKESAAIINRIWNDIDDKNSIDRESYTRISAQLSEYEVNSIIMRMLKPDASIPSVPTNSTDIEALYQSSLEKESNQRATTVRELQLQSELGIIINEGGISLTQALQDLQESRNEQDALRQQQEMEAARERESFSINQRAMLASYTPFIPENSDSSSVSAMITEIEALKGTYISYKNQIQLAMDNYETMFEKDSQRERDRIYSEPYLQFELDRNGKPLREAREAREEAAKERISELRKKYEDMTAKAYADAIGPFEEIAERAAKAIEDLNNASFTLTTPSSAVSTSIDYFSLTELTWYGNAEMTIGNQTVSFDFGIPFASWTGRKISNGETYYDYRAEIQDWSTILAAYPFSYSLTINYTISTYADTAEYDVVIKDYTVTRTDTGKDVYHARPNQHKVLDYNTPVDFSDISVDTSLLNEDNPNYPSSLVARIEQKTEKLTYSYERDLEQKERFENEAKSAAKRKRQNFRPYNLTSTNIEYKFLTNTSFTANDSLINMKVQMLELLGFYPSINCYLIYQQSDLSAYVFTFGLDRYFALTGNDAIKIEAEAGAMVSGNILQETISFAAFLDLGYFHSFGLITLELGASAAYMADEFRFGGYAGLGVAL
ncbi:MAG: hypothetical protein IAA97_08635 [Spirochaetes bacterium]|uniref:Uncharacterized protein n=1 Tax=Candidatus Ornithospirochaeta stercoripullorum TaxID=2840899 RepID=A0A9D9H2T0_9SPIO|nr:hypothetical protein [Candidatus Ornithospirochaeta stercoripullorum]